MKKQNHIITIAVFFAFLFIAAITLSGFAVDKVTDADITNWVRNALQNDARVNASIITVNTENGIVTLSGVAASIVAKQYADLEAKKIAGVRGVINNILPLPKWRSDEDIRNALQRRILNSTVIDSKTIKVTSQNGKITLTGKVHTLEEKKKIGLFAGEIRGVKKVKNEIRVHRKSKRSDREIKNDAMTVLNIDVYMSGLPITVSVKDGVVTLEGTVESGYEKNKAGHDIFLVSNVKEVQNKLTIDIRENHGVRTSQIKVSDEDLKLYVKNMLDQDRRINASSISTKIFSGRVTLNGSVEDYHEKHIIEQDVRDVVGVIDIKNNLSTHVVKREN